MSCASTVIWIYLAAAACFAPGSVFRPDVFSMHELAAAVPSSLPCGNQLQSSSLGARVAQPGAPCGPVARSTPDPAGRSLQHPDPQARAVITGLQPLPFRADDALSRFGSGLSPAPGPGSPDAFFTASHTFIQPVPAAEGIHWGPVLGESLFFLGIEHGYRLLDPTQPYTRAALKGPFFSDWFVTVKDLKGWSDNDPFIINYVGHPVQGAVSGRILVQNDPSSKLVMPSLKREYRRTCLKAFGWAFLYELQFELGPISEASLGNSKGTPQYPHPTSYVDIVITPVVGIGWMIGEDFADRGIARLEPKVHNRPLIIAMRLISNPSRTMANVLRIKWPWRRDDRF